MNIRMTFAIGSMGPSSDGDSGEYYLASIVRPKPAEYLLNLSLREWGEAQMLDALEAQGQILGERLAFVAFMGSEEEEGDPRYWRLDLNEDHIPDLQAAVDSRELVAIVDENQGGIIAYALAHGGSLTHANRIVEALSATSEEEDAAG